MLASGVNVVVTWHHRVLLTFRGDLPVWRLPGGAIEPRETLEETTMTAFHHRPLPDDSTLLAGPAPRDEVGFPCSELQIWYNNTGESWVGQGERPHKHEHSVECFIVLRGSLTVEVAGEQFEVKAREFCCFPPGVYHAIVAVAPPVETLMIRAPSVADKVYQER